MLCTVSVWNYQMIQIYMLNFNLKIRNDRYKWWHGYLGWQWQRRSLKPIVAQLDLLIQVSSHCGLQKVAQETIMAIYNIYIVDIVYFYNLSKCQCTAEQNVAQGTIMAIYNCIYNNCIDLYLIQVSTHKKTPKRSS